MKEIKTANILLIVLIGLVVIGLAMFAFTKEELSDGVTSVPINKKLFGFGATKTTTAKIQDLSNPSDQPKTEGV